MSSSFCAKCLHPSHEASESPLYKGNVVRSSLPSSLPNSSRHLSHDQSSDIKNRIGGIEEDNGRVMGEIKIISPVLDSFCLKGFQKKKGGMRDYSKNLCFLNLTAKALRPTSFVLNLNPVIYSQRGNTLFPGWECFVPRLGIKKGIGKQNWRGLRSNLQLSRVFNNFL